MRDRITFFFVLLIALCTQSNVYAQKKPYLPPVPPRDTSKFLIFEDMAMGPYFTAGISRQNEDLPLQWASKPRFANAFGVTLDASVNSWLGIALTALYDARDLYADSTGENIDISLGYISLEPSIRIFWLLVGLAFEFPMSGSANESITSYQHPSQTAQPYSQNLNISSSDIAQLTELRATLSVPLFEEESGMVHLIISGSYPLSKVLNGTSSFDTTMHFSGKSAPGQGPLPSIEAGLTYQFDLIH